MWFAFEIMYSIFSIPKHLNLSARFFFFVLSSSERDRYVTNMNMSNAITKLENRDEDYKENVLKIDKFGIFLMVGHVYVCVCVVYKKLNRMKIQLTWKIFMEFE